MCFLKSFEAWPYIKLPSHNATQGRGENGERGNPLFRGKVEKAGFMENKASA